MSTLGDASARTQLIARMALLTEDSKALWGQMTVGQMLRHCRLWEEMKRDIKQYSRPLIGRIIGPLILKQVLRQPLLRRNSPTIPEMVVRDQDIDLNAERKLLTELLVTHVVEQDPTYRFLHPFFGRMTQAQIDRLGYLHLDHHLRQFGV